MAAVAVTCRQQTRVSAALGEADASTVSCRQPRAVAAGGVGAGGAKLAGTEAFVSGSVDYRLVGRWEASRRRQQAAREALPPAWRTLRSADPVERAEHPVVVGSSAIARFPLDDR